MTYYGESAGEILEPLDFYLQHRGKPGIGDHKIKGIMVVREMTN
jgi:hypothetical protein